LSRWCAPACQRSTGQQSASYMPCRK